MGREMKMVALDFDWPMKEKWEGYLNPYYKFFLKCLDCDGSGYSPEAKNISDQWYGYSHFKPSMTNSKLIKIDDNIMQKLKKHHNWSQGHMDYIIESWNSSWCYHIDQDDVQALVDKDRLMDFTRRPRTKKQIKEHKKNDGYWMKESNGYIPTAEEVNAWSKGDFGHDSSNHYICVRAKCKRLGIQTSCEECDGTGDLTSEENRKKAEEWKSIDPPTGDGFQLWETTSEGSPSSPVFDNMDKLAKWCEKNATTFGSFTATKKQWLDMFKEDFIKHQDGNVTFM